MEVSCGGSFIYKMCYTLGLSKAERSKGPIVRDVPLDLSPLRIPAI